MSDGKEMLKKMQSDIKEFFSKEITTEQLNSFTEEERMNYYEDLKNYRDLKNCLDYAYEEGKRKGLKEAKEKLQTAKNLLLEGLSIDLIAKTTGLTVKEIQQIKDNL